MMKKYAVQFGYRAEAEIIEAESPGQAVAKWLWGSTGWSEGPEWEMFFKAWEHNEATQ